MLSSNELIRTKAFITGLVQVKSPLSDVANFHRRSIEWLIQTSRTSYELSQRIRRRHSRLLPSIFRSIKRPGG
ncbi:protein of unknown function (plasmid) [Caballeronia sp. S22]